MRFRRKADDNKKKIKATLDLTPLIDVVFQLLIFFMLSATFVVQSSIQVEMPRAEGAATLEQKDLTITLAYLEGVPSSRMPLYVDNVQVTDTQELARVLAAIVQERPNVAALLRPDRRIPVERFVEVLGIAKSVGIQTFNIGAEPPSEDADG